MSVFHSEHRPYVIYLDGKQIIWGGDDLKNLIPIALAEGTIVDLQIPNQKIIENQLTTWIDQYGIKPRETVIIIGPELMYMQEFPVKNDAEVQAFLDKIPFDDLAVKRIPNASGETVTVISAELLQPLLELFKHHQFTILAVYPYTVIKQTNPPTPLNNEMLSAIMPQLEILEPLSFYSPPRLQESMTSIRNSEGKIFSPRLVLMIILFTGLIVLLLVVLGMNGYFGGATPSQPVAPIVQPVIEETVEPTIEPLPTPLEASSESEIATDSASTATPSAIEATEQINEN